MRTKSLFPTQINILYMEILMLVQESFGVACMEF